MRVAQEEWIRLNLWLTLSCLAPGRLLKHGNQSANLTPLALVLDAVRLIGYKVPQILYYSEMGTICHV